MPIKKFNYKCLNSKCKNEFSSNKILNGKWYEKPQCGICGGRDMEKIK